jgi:hypothetical protein
MSPRLRISAKELMAYLQNYGHHLGHISRGMIECLVKQSILLPLEFSDFEKMHQLH